MIKVNIRFNLVVILILIGFQFAHCQITVNAFASQDTICAGHNISLNANGNSYLYNNNFNNGTIGNGWSSTNANPVFTNPCPFNNTNGPNGLYLWVGATASTVRTLETKIYDISSNACFVNFWMRYGADPHYSNCEDPDNIDEGVHLQYSIDTGATWISFLSPNVEPIGNLSLNTPYSATTTKGSGGYWQPHLSLTAQQASGLYYWNEYSCPVPAGALTNATKFRWAQLNNSGVDFDTWGIDEVEIVCQGFILDYAWLTPLSGDTVSHLQNPSSFQVPYPTSPSSINGVVGDTCWIVCAWDSTGNIAYDTVCVTIMLPPSTPIISQASNLLTSSSPIGNQWYYNFVAIPNETAQTLQALQSGIYHVAVNNPCGTTLSLPYNFIVTSTLESINDEFFNIYPNPNNGRFVIELYADNNEEAMLSVLTIDGRKVYSEEIGCFIGRKKIDLNIQLSQGLYFVQLEMLHGKIVRKLIVN